jgi:spore maturation protein CgeB
MITDAWEGLETFFTPGRELLVSRSSHETLQYLRDISEEERQALGARARTRVLTAHTAAHRVEMLQGYVEEVWKRHRMHAVGKP